MQTTLCKASRKERVRDKGYLNISWLEGRDKEELEQEKNKCGKLWLIW
jgi:hypothetical protein